MRLGKPYFSSRATSGSGKGDSGEIVGADERGIAVVKDGRRSTVGYRYAYRFAVVKRVEIEAGATSTNPLMRSVKRRALLWARLIDATLEDGELLLSFVGREVTFYGLSLGGLLDSVVECRLEKVWELSDDYSPPATFKRPRVSKIEVCNSDC